jgi:hypothetical protein
LAVKREAVAGKYRKLCYGDLRDLHASPNAINVIKSRKMVWAGHAKRMGERRDADSSLI